MPNRFYRPSAPQYTSQFVEDKYPFEQMLSSQRYKTAEKKQIASQVGQLEALNASITAGGRTQNITPVVKDYWNQKLAHAADKISGMSTQEATRSISRLRAEYMGDPNLQLIRQDLTKGDPEYAGMRKSKTFNLDVNKNIDPETGRLKQFGLAKDIEGYEGIAAGQTYEDYTPLTYYDDFEKSILSKLKDVKSRSSKVSRPEIVKDPITGLPMRRQVSGSINILDEKVFADPVKEITEDLMEGRTQAANYMKSKWEQEGRPWTKESITDYVKDLSVPLYDQDDQTTIQDRPLTASELKALDIDGGPGTRPTRVHKTPPSASAVDIEKPGIVERIVNVRRWFHGLEPLDTEIEQDRSFQNAVAFMQRENPDIEFETDAEARKAVKEYKKSHIEKGEYDKINQFTVKERENMQKLYGGEETAKGHMKYDVTPALLLDARIVDMSDPDEDEVKTSEKEGWTKKDKTMTTKGILGQTNRFGPGYIMLTAGDKDYAFSPTDQEKEPYRLGWNLGGWARNDAFNTVAHDDVKDKAEHFKFYGYDTAGNEMIVDRENSKTQSYHGPYFTIVPRLDHRPYDDEGNPATPGRFIIDVYKYEPNKESFVSSVVAPPEPNNSIVGAWYEFEKLYDQLKETHLGNNQ